MAANNDDSKKTSYTQALEGYKGQSLPSTGIPVKIREVFLDSMLHYGFDADAVSRQSSRAWVPQTLPHGKTPCSPLSGIAH